VLAMSMTVSVMSCGGRTDADPLSIGSVDDIASSGADASQSSLNRGGPNASSGAGTSPNSLPSDQVDSGEDLNALFATLSSSELWWLCDAIAAIYGGYGVTLDCENGTTYSFLAGPQRDDTCVSKFVTDQGNNPNCPATESDVLTCVAWHVDHWCTIDPGSPPQACAAYSSNKCGF
jgi:hypothetical protein